MTPITLLLDLDNTLLDSNMEIFLPTYLQALASHLSSWVAPDTLLAALRAGVDQMVDNDDPARTLQEVFEEVFYTRIGIQALELRPAIRQFYDEVFPTLGKNMRPKAGARELVQWAVSSGHQIVVATDPLFPQQATNERVRWAGLNPAEFQLIASFETFHYSKSNLAYFTELIGRLGWPERPIVMAGDDLQRDIQPANRLGLTTFHVDGARPGRMAPAKSEVAALAQPAGDLNELRKWLASAAIESYAPRTRDRETILAILSATPGVLESLVEGLGPTDWSTEPSPEDWAMIELICHLRDTEREVHAVQIRTLLESPVPFVPRPDAAVWAKQRRYLREHGPAALRAFTAARVDMLRQLETLPEDVWAKTARHAIFGPTDFQEVIGFMADHDRMHLQQAWATLNSLQVPAHRF